MLNYVQQGDILIHINFHHAVTTFKLIVEWMSGLPAPELVLEILSCTCSCIPSKCTCMQNGLKCTEMCSLKSCENKTDDLEGDMFQMTDEDDNGDGGEDCSDED